MFAIGLSGVFSLGGWCRQIQTGFLRSRPTQGTAACRLLARTGLSPSVVGLSRPFRFVDFHACAALQPRARRNGPGLGSFPFARHYLGNHSYFLLLRVLRCFSSPGSPTTANVVWRDRSRRVSPFGHPRVAGHLPLTAAFRSLSRPSSPPRATGIPHAPFLPFLVPSSPGRAAVPTPGASRTSARSLSLDRSFNSISRFDSLLFAFPTCQ